MTAWTRLLSPCLLLALAAGTVRAQTAAPAAAQTAHASSPAPRRDRDKAQRFFVEGARAVDEHRLPDAVKAFTEANTLDPANRDYEASLAIARSNLATQLMQQGMKARLGGDQAAWKRLFAEAAAVDSRNPLVLEHELDVNEDAPRQQSELPAPVEDDGGSPVDLKPMAQTQDFHLMLPKGELLREVLHAYGLNAVVDSSVGSERVHFDADGATFAQAAQMLTLATGTFAVPLDPKRALFALDTKDNRDKYERQAQETIYLPGLSTAELTDVGNIARNLFGAQPADVHETSRTVTLRAPASRMRAFNVEMNELLAGRSEVMLDINVYEVQTQHMVNEGAQLPQTTTAFNLTSEVDSLIKNNASLVQQIISSGLASPGNIEEIAVALLLSGQAGSSILSQPFAYFGGGLTTTGLSLASATANLQLNDSTTRIVDSLQLRLGDQEEGSLKIGERYPIVTSSFSNLATSSTGIAGITSAGLSNTLQNLGINLSSLASAAVPQVQYQDIGLILTATPRVEQARDVALKLKLQISSLSGQSINSNPIINNRQSDAFITVKPGEKTVLFSQLSEQESAALIGIPFLSEIPGLALYTNRDVTKTRDSLVVIITPHIVRLTHTRLEGQMVLLPTHS